jgi:DNA-binding sugar fermentation-stimulating protein
VELRWRKSSFSTDTGACVEVAEDGERILLRESDEPGVVICTTRRKLRAFIEGAKAGEFDDLVR